MSGPYGRRAYVESLAGDRDAVEPLWDGHVLLRPVVGIDRVDAASAYPMGGFAAGTEIGDGLDALRARGAICLSVVADPLNSPAPEALAAQADHHKRLKTHYVLDRGLGPFQPSKHHRYEIRRAHKRVAVDRVILADVMADWTRLYDHLADRHGIDPAAQLGPRHFDALAVDPQAVVFAARLESEVVALSIWLSDGDVAHNHLGASSEVGYAAGASYALYSAAIEHLSGCRRLDLGGMPGLVDDPAHGLARFKRGFANTERATWLSGFILDPEAYSAATVGAGVDPATAYFPAFRAR